MVAFVSNEIVNLLCKGLYFSCIFINNRIKAPIPIQNYLELVGAELRLDVVVLSFTEDFSLS